MFCLNFHATHITIGDCLPKIIVIDQCLLKLFENIAGVQSF